MKHLDAYTYAALKDVDPNLIIDLELTHTQRAELGHHINNPLTIAIWSLEQARTQIDEKTYTRMKDALSRIGKYVSEITGTKAAS